MAKPKVPQKYIGSLSESTADKRKAEIRKRIAGKKADKYEPLPGDSKAKTRKSKYTGKVTRSGLRDAILEESQKQKGSQSDRFVKAVAKVTGVPKSIIDTVMKRGAAAWAIGHRPGATQAQWQRARVYSFLTGGKTTTTGDADLYAKAKKALKDKGSTFKL
jgi:hypothetical protein